MIVDEQIPSTSTAGSESTSIATNSRKLIDATIEYGAKLDSQFVPQTK